MRSLYALFISLFRSPFRPYNRAYAYRGLTAFAPLSMAVSGGLNRCVIELHLSLETAM
ncbi:MAG: hypothetical protein KZQ60_17515 [Candidatus Thiodiazotropha sp. (ex Lucinoma aequizonata)]|nr:hypothetical protein [Candidatus Thiodiazotropha sp. (ex Lucinoma aequizonata)]